MRDGYELPLTVWKADGTAQAIVLALHGFNDYRNAFADPGKLFAASGITTYAYDQRGFGETQQRGLWPGTETLLEDVRSMIGLLCATHPGVPLYLVGDSMGGAATISLLEDSAPDCIHGVILIAPAVWGWQTMPVLQRAALQLMAHVAPGYRPSPEGLDIMASDNIEMLRAQGRDPLVIKETRIDTLYGLVDLMESALLASRQLQVPTLILYGEKDEIIPRRPTCQMIGELPDAPPANWRLVIYPDGYHMLTRDLQAHVVLQDMVAWLHDPRAVLPSDYETSRDGPRVQALCEKYRE
ncbi:MAG: lysophospholipase [Gammaproteobacteria bacterium]|nr:MAG: lysophospholipase [Gammaproteobacteria bacterium]